MAKKGLRACPICPECGGKKFRIVSRQDNNDQEEENSVTRNDSNGSSSEKINITTITVECIVCTRRITI